MKIYICQCCYYETRSSSAMNVHSRTKKHNKNSQYYQADLPVFDVMEIDSYRTLDVNIDENGIHDIVWKRT